MSNDKKQKKDPFKYYKQLAKEWESRTKIVKIPKLWKFKIGEIENVKTYDCKTK